VLAQIARRTGLVVTTAAPSRHQVSVNFSGLPLRRALAQLMSRENYAIVERPRAGGGEPVLVVMILGPGPAKSAPPSIRAAAAGAPKDHLAALMDAIHNGGANSDQALRASLSDSDPNVRTLALQTLGERGGNAGADALFQAARAEQPATRLAALEVLGEHGDVDPVPRLTEALRDPDPEVKGYAMQLLLQKGGPQAVQALRQAFNSDPDPSFRAFVSEALSNYNANHAAAQAGDGP
jgi:HEAT repeat protein